MPNNTEAEIREIRLKIENLVTAAGYCGLPQEATTSYLKEVQKLRLRLLHLGVKPDRVCNRQQNVLIALTAVIAALTVVMAVDILQRLFY